MLTMRMDPGAASMRALWFTLIWWTLAGGDTASLWVGALAVIIAVIVSMVLVAPQSLDWLQLARFVPFFIARSILGGADVAWRAFHPRVPIAPALVDYPIRLPSGQALVYFVNAVSLLPGTLSADLDGRVLRLHVLDVGKEFASEIDAVERRLAAIFRVGISSADRMD